MFVINAENVNDAWKKAKVLLNTEGIPKPSRVGNVLEVPDPVTTKYRNPRERVLFDAKRNCNPFFHFMEGLWMLAGRNDVAFPSIFAQRMMSFSDDGKTFHAAYGHRWRQHFATDQLPVIVKMLKDNNSERRAVLQMWNPISDLGSKGNDLPCNTNVYFKVRDGRLFMTVCNRSNDIVWGCYGANVVHMSMLQEYMASMIGVDVGPYHQVSDSWHAYTEFWEPYGGLDVVSPVVDLYQTGAVVPYVMVKDPLTWDLELQNFMSEPLVLHSGNTNPLFNDVARIMYKTWRAHKDKQYSEALYLSTNIEASDWATACAAWLLRAKDKRESK